MKVKVAFLCGVSAMALAAADSGSSAVEAATHRTDARATVSTSAGTMTVDLPATSQEFGTRFSSETSYPGFLSNMTPPGDGYPNVSQRLDSSNLDVWRVQGGDGYNTLTTTLPSPCNYTSKTHQTVSAWNFTGADNTLSEGPTGAPREFDLTAPPDCLFTGSAPLGGNGKAQGALADQSYDAMATWAADVVKYFRTGILISDSGNTVSYTSNSLTDTDQDFSAYGGGGYSVTATVDNANGFSDWETAVVTSVSGPNDDTLNFSAGWSDADSYDVAAQDSLLETTTPEDGAAYNLASTTPPAGLTSPEVATPWPCPPSVGNVEYIELVNEPDLSNYNEPRISPAMPPPAPTVTGANVPGGTLTVGKQYSYRITAMDTRGDESKPGSQVTVTLPAGDNAVQLSWSATSNLGLSPASYRIYGRTSGTEKAMVVVGSTNPDGLNWTDTGGVVPSGAMPKKNNTVGSQVFAPETYLKMWNVVAPAIKAVDPTVKLVGPTISNAQSVCGCDDVLTNVVTTGPSDDSYLNTEDYIPVLMSGANPKPDVISFHAYGDYEGTSSTEADYWSGLQNEISNFVSVDQAAVGSTPVWIDETNIDAGFFGSEPSATDMRAMTQMGSAWLADSVIQWATQAPQVKELFQFEANGGDAAWTLFSGSSYAGNTACVPQPACQDIAAEQPDLEYWLVREMNAWLPSGNVVPVSNIPTDFSAIAVQTSPTTLAVVLVNTAVGAGDGNGSPGTANVQVSGATVSDTQEMVIDGSTSMANGPAATDLGAQNNVAVSANGYAVTLLQFTIASTTSGAATTTTVVNRQDRGSEDPSGMLATRDGAEPTPMAFAPGRPCTQC